TGITEAEIPADFAITVGGKTLTIADADQGSAFPTYTWTLEEMPEGTYSVTESGAEVDGYTLSYTAPEAADLLKDGEITFTLTNEYTAKPGTIIITKTFTGITEADIPADFTVKMGDKTLTIADADAGSAFPTYTWTLEEMPEGTYSVTESGAEVDGYTLSFTEPEAAELEKDGTITFVLENDYEKIPITGTRDGIVFWTGSLMAAMAGMLFLVFAGRRKVRKVSKR
ncbi:MAG: hypothetical protein J6Z38_00855, partial [Lachnospiraceae bacterium]|nr:hypothetical protein [Lachnospiraceae bacterium]